MWYGYEFETERGGMVFAYLSVVSRTIVGHGHHCATGARLGSRHIFMQASGRQVCLRGNEPSAMAAEMM